MIAARAFVALTCAERRRLVVARMVAMAAATAREEPHPLRDALEAERTDGDLGPSSHVATSAAMRSRIVRLACDRPAVAADATMVAMVIATVSHLPEEEMGEMARRLVLQAGPLAGRGHRSCGGPCRGKRAESRRDAASMRGAERTASR